MEHASEPVAGGEQCCGRCLYHGAPYARRVHVCAREGSPYGDEETAPDQSCELFEPDDQRERVIGAPMWSTRILPVWNEPEQGLCVTLCQNDDRVLQVVDGQVTPPAGQYLRYRVPAVAVAALLRRAGAV